MLIHKKTQTITTATPITGLLYFLIRKQKKKQMLPPLDQRTALLDNNQPALVGRGTSPGFEIREENLPDAPDELKL
jgi:hypothetical protein